jgi:hypothetical protein
MKAIKRILGCMIVFAALTGISGIGYADEDPDGSSVISEKYTIEEFDSLSDQEKRDVYYNHPQQLPDDFESINYKDIMHPELEEE